MGKCMMGLIIANGRLIHIADKESPSLVVRQYGEALKLALLSSRSKLAVVSSPA
jgi:hypothetical protein